MKKKETNQLTLFPLAPPRRDKKNATRLEEIGTSTTHVELCNLGLTEIPSVIFQYPQIEDLNLAYNAIKQIPIEIRH
jgi:Leucine-rich repeat (LRR) protein